MQRPQARLGTQEDATVSRLIAFVVDAVLIGVVLGVVLGVVGAVLGGLLGRTGGLLTGLLAPLGGLAVLVYFIYMEGAYGQTIGKRLMGVVVVKDDGSDCDMRASAIRNVVRIVDALPTLYIVGLAVMFLVGDDRQRVGDILANTLVVKTA